MTITKVQIAIRGGSGHQIFEVGEVYSKLHFPNTTTFQANKVGGGHVVVPLFGVGRLETWVKDESDLFVGKIIKVEE